MTDFGVDITSPHPPFIIPKLVGRYVLRNPLSPLQGFSRFVVGICGRILGTGDWGPGVPPGGGGVGGGYGYEGGDMGMDGDEFL